MRAAVTGEGDVVVRSWQNSTGSTWLGVSGVGRQKAKGGTRIWIVMGLTTHTRYLRKAVRQQLLHVAGTGAIHRDEPEECATVR